MSLWSRLFGRKPVVIADHRQPNDWKPGDLAVCIDGDDWRPGSAADPQTGDVLRVSAVEDQVSNLPGNERRSYFLYFAEKGPDSCWEYTAFRKAEQDSAPAEAEFTALLRRPIRPKVTAGEEWR